MKNIFVSQWPTPIRLLHLRRRQPFGEQRMCTSPLNSCCIEKPNQKSFRVSFNHSRGRITPGAVLSADLCLRFFPDIIRQLRIIDTEDSLTGILENIIRTWHYSGISLGEPVEELDPQVIISDPCLLQLYCDRIIQYKNRGLANDPNIKQHIAASMGNFSSRFWPEFQQIDT